MRGRKGAVKPQEVLRPSRPLPRPLSPGPLQAAGRAPIPLTPARRRKPRAKAPVADAPHPYGSRGPGAGCGAEAARLSSMEGSTAGERSTAGDPARGRRDLGAKRGGTSPPLRPRRPVPPCPPTRLARTVARTVRRARVVSPRRPRDSGDSGVVGRVQRVGRGRSRCDPKWTGAGESVRPLLHPSYTVKSQSQLYALKPTSNGPKLRDAQMKTRHTGTRYLN